MKKEEILKKCDDILGNDYNLPTEKAFDNKDWKVRLNAYRTLGFTEKAFDDEEWVIRQGAYKALGFTEKALEDDNCWIRKEAAIHFRSKLS